MKQIIITGIIVLTTAFNAYAVTIHEADPKIENGLNQFGTGIKN